MKDAENGFDEYKPGEAEEWGKTFKDFSYEIRELALKLSG